MKKIIIAGGGFAGVRAALDLEKKRPPNTKITLISKLPHLEYHAALYRVVTGRNPLEVCIPLAEIFKNKDVEIVEDEIVKLDLADKQLVGKNEAKYKYDYLVLALGSQTSYYGIPGLKNMSYGLKSVNEALRLREHLHELFEKAAKSPDTDKKVTNAHFVVVGGGATGTETAGELASYTDKLSKNHGLPREFITIDLIHSREHLVPNLPEDFSEKIEHRLRHLGVNLFMNRRVIKEDIEKVYLKDMQLKTKTVIWTAGVTLNSLYKDTKELKKDKDGRPFVNTLLEARGNRNVFIVGDAASVKHPGMAQSAISDGRFVAEVIANGIKNKKPPRYRAARLSYSIPVGEGWAATLWHGVAFHGKTGWILRRLADFKFFLSILPPKKAYLAFKSGRTLCEYCSVCSQSGAY